MAKRWIVGATYGAILFLGAGAILLVFRRPEPARDPDAGIVPTSYTPPDLTPRMPIVPA